MGYGSVKLVAPFTKACADLRAEVEGRLGYDFDEDRFTVEDVREFIAFANDYLATAYEDALAEFANQEYERWICEES